MPKVLFITQQVDPRHPALAATVPKIRALAGMVDEVVVMMAPGHLDAVRAIVRNGGYDKVSAIEEGGLTRNETTQRALAAIGEGESHVLFHDAVRPLISARIITECFEALEEHPAVDVAIASADTIIEVGTDNTIREIPPRAALRRGAHARAGAIRVTVRG